MGGGSPSAASLVPAATPQASESRLFVGNLPEGTTKEDLSQFMATYGQVPGGRVVCFAIKPLESHTIKDLVVRI